MKNVLVPVALFLSVAVCYGQSNDGLKKDSISSLADDKYAAMEKEIQILKEEQRAQLLRTYATEWQMNRAAEAPHVLARKLKIEKDALKDGFTVEDMKQFIEEEKKAKKAQKKANR